MAKAKQSRSETSAEALLERVQRLEARLATVEAGLEAEAALFAVSPRAVVDGGPAQGEPAAVAATDAAAPAVTGAADPALSTNGQVNGALELPRQAVFGTADPHQDGAEPEGADETAVADVAARRKQPDSPLPFTPGDLRSRLGKPGGVMFTGAARLPRNVRAAWQRELAMVDLLDGDWAAEAEQIAALGHPVRLALLREVLKGARSVSALASLPGLGTSGQLYHHLKPLLAEGWLQPAGRGRYEVPNDRILPLLGIIAAMRRP